MHPTRVLLLALAVSALTHASLAASTESVEEAMSADGLQKIEVKGIDIVYAAPGATLAPYAKVRIEPVSVAFHKDFEPKRMGSHTKLDAGELEDIRAALANLVREEFATTLQRGSYLIVEESGPDVLHARARIVDLIVNAPDTMEAGRNNSFTESTGEMTLVLELSDSATGRVIARAHDREETLENGQLNWTTRVTNEADARMVVRNWARILRIRLDAARAVAR